MSGLVYICIALTMIQNGSKSVGRITRWGAFKTTLVFTL